MVGVRDRLRDLSAVVATVAVLAAVPGGSAAVRAAEENALEGHPSPYLALHATDPVNWRVLDEASAAAARSGDRLLFVSVGYFSCHWCHVMQRESFKNAQIAEKLNTRFVPFKVDRELQPALDARLNEFAEQTVGQSGWPLNVFVTPEGHPLHAALYMPASQLIQVLDRIDALWLQDRERLSALAARAAQSTLPEAMETIDQGAVRELERVFVAQASALHDDFQGGFGNQSKFPQAPALEYLLDLAFGPHADTVVPILELTLDAMASEGLYDHIGGGFFRYVIDPGWMTPHFEKMLYDNALLARVYLRASRLLPGRGYEGVARETLDFLRREMMTPGGGLAASLSAVDGEDVEGGYYLFRDEELAALLDARSLRVVRARCDISGVPLLSAGHHLRCSRSLRHVAKNLGITESEAHELFRKARGRLLEARAARELPVDTKVLAGWNGLALSAFVDGADAFDDPAWLAEHGAAGGNHGFSRRSGSGPRGGRRGVPTISHRQRMAVVRARTHRTRCAPGISYRRTTALARGGAGAHGAGVGRRERGSGAGRECA